LKPSLKRRNNTKFSVGLGPGGAHQADFYFTATLGTDIFFIDTNCLLFLRERAPPLAIAKKQLTGSVVHLRSPEKTKIGKIKGGPAIYC